MIFLLKIYLSKRPFTWSWGTPDRWGNPLRWGNPPVHKSLILIWSGLHVRWGNLAHVTSPIYHLTYPLPPCKQALTTCMYSPHCSVLIANIHYVFNLFHTFTDKWLQVLKIITNNWLVKITFLKSQSRFIKANCVIYTWQDRKNSHVVWKKFHIK